MNKIIIVGRLTANPESRFTQTGKQVASFTLASNRPKSANGISETDFIPIVAWEKLAELSEKYLAKGLRTLVEGRLQIRSYQTKDGQKRKIAEIIAERIELIDRITENPQPFGGQVMPDEEIPF